MNRSILLVLLLFAAVTSNAQNFFQFEAAKSKVVVRFKLINNLIFVPIKVNGVELNFLLDTGVEETILLSLEDKEEVRFFNAEKIKLKGLGSDVAVEGLKSSNNMLDFGGLIDKNHDLYIVLDQNFNFSAHVGIPVNGIIGYHFFKNNLVEVDYEKKRITVYQDNAKFRKKVAAKFDEIPITIEKNKPYLLTGVRIAGEHLPAKLLIDIGNSDALWLFENKSKGIKIPQNNFSDYLGMGFSGEIYGNRARISELQIGKFEFKNPIIAFPDSASIKSVTMVKDRLGSAGGEILKRFTVIFDYPERKMYLKKNSSFGNAFHYNMSGIELQNEGLQWVQETVVLQTQSISENNTYDGNGNKSNFKYKFSLKPIYIISSVRKNSAAELCGLQKGDAIKKINGVPSYYYSLAKINDLLKSEEGKWINLLIIRNEIEMKYKFQLKSML